MEFTPGFEGNQPNPVSMFDRAAYFAAEARALAGPREAQYGR
jgi:hypothetical protein